MSRNHPTHVTVTWMSRYTGEARTTWHRRLDRGELPWKYHGNSKVVPYEKFEEYMEGRGYPVPLPERLGMVIAS